MKKIAIIAGLIALVAAGPALTDECHEMTYRQVSS